jgi:hypothetical protein
MTIVYERSRIGRETVRTDDEGGAQGLCFLRKVGYSWRY